MINTLKKALLAAAALIVPSRAAGADFVFVGRARTCDSAYTAFPYRMPAGFPGTVNRSHPCSIEPCQIDFDDPPTRFGQAVIVDSAANSIRTPLAGDNALTNVYGFAVRPYPVQQTSGGLSAGFAEGGPALDQPIDVLRWGYIMSKINEDDTGPGALKGGRVYVYIGAETATRKPGFLETADDGANTIPINGTFNGPPDAENNVEVIFNINPQG